MSGLRNALIIGVTLILCVVDLVHGEVVTAKLDRAMSFKDPPTPGTPDILRVNSGPATIKAIKAQKIQGVGYTRIEISSPAQGSGIVPVAEVIHRADRDCLFRVEGVYMGNQGNATWDATYNKGVPRILMRVNGPGKIDDYIGYGDNGAKLTVTLAGTSTSQTDITLSAIPSGLVGFSAIVLRNVKVGDVNSIILKGIAPGTVTITATAGALTKSVEAEVVNFRARLDPFDKFGGRSPDKVGVGEEGWLLVDVFPPAAKPALRPLHWEVSTDQSNFNIRMQNPDDGSALFNAGTKDEEVAAEVTSGLGVAARSIVLRIPVCEPKEAVYEYRPFEGVFHKHKIASVAFSTKIYLQPKDVSFVNIKFKEGEAIAKDNDRDGYFWLHYADGVKHPEWSHAFKGKLNDATKGCLMCADEAGGILDKGPVISGKYLWNIPLLWTPIATPWAPEELRPFTQGANDTVRHFLNMDDAGTVTLEKQHWRAIRALNDPSGLLNGGWSSPGLPAQHF